MHVKVKELPDSLQSALAAVGYARSDVAVHVKEQTSVRDYGSGGCRAFVCLVNLATGEHTITYGSWGGPNAYALDNAIDRDDRIYTIPHNGAVIHGSEGGDRPVSASVTLPPSNVLPVLQSPPTVTADEAQVLAVFRGIKSSYRAEYLQGKAAMVDSLVERGYLKRNKAGATSITTEGKNACEGVRLS